MKDCLWDVFRTQSTVFRRRAYFFGFFIGGAAYFAIEFLWRTLGNRGETHHSMFFLGGLSLLLIMLIDRTHLPTPVKAILSGAGITSFEFALGFVCKYILHRILWEYGTAEVLGIISWTWSLLWCFFALLALLVLHAVANRRRT